MTLSSGLQDWKVACEISPIILCGGIAQNIPGGMIPIVSILETQNYDLGLLSSSTDVDLDSFFGHFKVAPGASLIKNQFATWPYLNITVAANAVITQPLTVSLLMICPVNGDNTYLNKFAIMTALKQLLDQHTQLGGTYNVVTMSYLYVNCLLSDLREVDYADSVQPQVVWQWDFFQPLLTVAQAQAAQNAAMSRVSNQTQVSGNPPTSISAANTTGTANSSIATSTVPANQQLPAASVSSPNPSGI